MRYRALVAAFMLLGWSAGPLSAAEDAGLADLSAWTTEFQTVHRQYLMVLSQVSAIDALSRDLTTGKIGHRKAAAAMTAIDKRVRASLNRAAAAGGRLPEPPEVSRALRPVRKAAVSSQAYLVNLDRAVREWHKEGLALFASAGLGEEVRTRLVLRPLRQMVVILKSDTVLLNGKLPLYGRRQPEQQLTRAIIAANTAFVVIVDAVGLQLDGMGDIAKEQFASLSVLTNQGIDAINRGRQVARQTWFLTPQARAVGRDAYQETFSVEERIYLQLRAFAKSVAGEGDVEMLAPLLKDHHTRLRFLVEERLRLQEQRPTAAY